MKEFLMRLTSRKLLLTIAGIVLVTLLPEHADKIIQMIGLYIGAEGVADVVDRYKGGSTPQVIQDVQTEEVYDIDTNSVVTGKAQDAPLFNEKLKEDD